MSRDKKLKASLIFILGFLGAFAMLPDSQKAIVGPWGLLLIPCLYGGFYALLGYLLDPKKAPEVEVPAQRIDAQVSEE